MGYAETKKTATPLTGTDGPVTITTRGSLLRTPGLPFVVLR